MIIYAGLSSFVGVSWISGGVESFLVEKAAGPKKKRRKNDKEKTWKYEKKYAQIDNKGNTVQV